MRILSKNNNGYITIFISLILTVLLSLILLLVDGVGRNTTKVQSEMIAKLGMDSCLAEYNRELWDKYDQLYVDYSYGSGKGSNTKLVKHMKNYVDKNCKQEFTGYSSFVKLKNPYLEVEELTFATDEYCRIWKKQAVDIMKTTYGIEAFADVLSGMNSIQTNSELSLDVSTLSVGENENVKSITNRNENIKQKEYDDEREEKIQARIEYTEKGYGRGLTDDELKDIENEFPRKTADLRHKKENSIGICVQDLTDKYDEYRGKGILGAVIPGVTISGKKIERDSLATSRIAKESNSLSVTDEMLFNEYLFKHYGHFGNENDKAALSYELEYILSGRLGDDDNLRSCANKILMLRMAANHMYIQKDLTKQAQLQTVAAGLAAAILAPEAQASIYKTLQGMWVYAESFNDLKIIFNGGKVPLYKTYDDWKVSLEAAYKGNGSYTSDVDGRGIDYEGYLKILLYMMIGNEKAPRSVDLVEQNLGIKMTDCVYSVKACFGFMDDKGHSFLFTEKRSFE